MRLWVQMGLAKVLWLIQSLDIQDIRLMEEEFFKGEDITNLSPTDRARMGIFLAFQYPIGIPGVTVAGFLKTIMNIRRGENISLSKFNRLLKEKNGHPRD